MKYYKAVRGEYILFVGEGNIETSITKEEYDHILDVIHSKPPATETTDYRLRTDLIWEEYDLPPFPPDDPEADPEDYEAALVRLGVLP